MVAIRNQCRRAKVPFFFKQWGGVQKSKAGRELGGRTYDELPNQGRSNRTVPAQERAILLNDLSTEFGDLLSIS